MVKLFIDSKMRIFLTVWLGQVVSLLGSGLTNFALGVWVYQKTGSVTQFALISLFISLPLLLISPLAGVLVDSFNRRWVMILSDFGAGLSTLAVALLFITGRLEIWHIYLTTAISSTFNTFQRPAYSAAVVQLIPKKHLTRASGIVELGEGVAQLIAPILAGALLVTIKLKGIILIDFVTFLIALLALLLVRFPDIKPTNEANHTEAKNWLNQAAYGWSYLLARPGLLGLLILFAITNFCLGAVSVLVTPLILSIASATVLGTVMSIGGIGMLLGSIAISVWGGPKRQINAIFAFRVLCGFSIFAAGLRPSIPLFALAAFLIFFSLPIIRVSSHAIFQKKVAPEVQGRVFALKIAIVMPSMPLAYITTGPLADRIFEPLMSVNGLLAESMGKVIGVGPGRGIGLMFVVMGFLYLLITLIAYQYPHIRLVESQLPDAIAD